MFKSSTSVKCVLVYLCLFCVVQVYCMGTQHKRLCLFTCAKIRKNYNETYEDPAFIPWQVAVHKGDVFLSSPRINQAATATLVKVESCNNLNCILKPYPSEKVNTNGCSGLFSVTAIKVDCCDRLWVLDGGISGIDTPICGPRILVFCLKTNTLLHDITIPKEILEKKNHLETMEIDVNRCKCKTPYVYIGDQFGFSLYIMKFSCAKRYGVVGNKRCWSKILAKEFYPDSHHAVFTDGVNSLVFMIGLFKITLAHSKCSRNEDNWLYFHALSSVKECRIKTSYLKNASNCADESGYTKALGQVETLRGERCTQSSGEVITRNGIMFQALSGKQTIACWNSKTPYKWPFIVNLLKDEYFQTPTDLTISEDGRCLKKNNDGDDLYIVSSNFLTFALNGYTFPCNQVNGVLATAPISKLTTFGNLCFGQKNIFSCKKN